MVDRPIIFSAAMVRALLAGTKTQTRRLATSPLRRVEVGDRLYVREHWRGRKRMDGYAPRKLTMDPSRICYIADGVTPACPLGEWEWGKHRQGMHMPRWASRLTLIVEEIAFGPLQNISEADAIAEGVERVTDPRGDGWKSYETCPDGTPHPHAVVPNRSPVTSYRELWDSLHAADGQRWEDDPDVVALTFRVDHRNIDRIST